MKSLKNITIGPNLWHEIRRRLQSSVASSSVEFAIPARIEREPTDILKALESTIKRDPTAPHFKFHDDPFLTPLSKLQSRTYSMARESGKKTAMWIHKEHADLFQKDLSEPQIKAFLPPVQYDQKDQVSEEILLDLISQGNVTDALNVYKLLENDTSNETKQAVLELLCFYNGHHEIMDNLMEERWYQFTHNYIKNTWREHPEISKLFDYLRKQDSIKTVAAAYNTLICATAKYCFVERTWELYMECKRDNIPLTLEAYNHLIRLIGVLKGGDIKPQELLVQFFTEMAERGLHPNVHTLNAALCTAAGLQTPTLSLLLIKEILKTFKRFNTKLNLTSYYHIVGVYAREGFAYSNDFVDLINSLKEESFTIQDKDDVKFFVRAMEVASKTYCDRYAGDRLHSILLTGDNYKFIANSYAEGIYFRNYVSLLLATSPMQEFFEIYRQLVPHIYIPEPSLMYDILKTLQSCTPEIVTEYLPQLWSDTIIFDMLSRHNVISKFLYLMRTGCALPPDSPLHKTFAEASWTIWKDTLEKNMNRHQRIALEGSLHGDMLVLLLRANYIDEVTEILKHLTTDDTISLGVMEHEQIAELFQTCISQGYAMEALLLLEYCLKIGHENSSEMAKTLHHSLEVNPVLRSKLVKLVGADMLEVPMQNNTT